ncbi:MAG: PAS domain-containing protein [Desulfobacteraceae bacterium]|nr:PAS domain-containing protein [Desulfobacteraceae bacterium]MBC2756439.1 PAS domain-containing protein [Desulfobacteraceae bacterium]MBC2763569.1 PAS domain-containing protein [ANME-2 cluster archaeon]
MNVAIVGGGSKCLYLLNFIEQHIFQIISPKIIAVADTNTDAVGFVKARNQGLFVTQDYNDFFDRNDVDLIIELTGDLDIYNDILRKKKKNVRAIAHTTAILFWEISRIARKEQDTRLKLHEAKTIYEVMINELIEEDVMVIDTDYCITDINDTMLNKLGLKREKTIGHFCYEITHHRNTPCSGNNHPCPLTQSLETHKPSKTTHIHLDKSGNELYYSISCYPIKEKGEVTGVIEISSDITKDIKRQKNMMQQEKLMSIGRLSAGIAHEINNPLTTIMTSSMLLQEDTDPDDPIYGELETISKEALRCRNIVKSLLDFARQSKPVRKSLNFNQIIMDTIFLVQKQAGFNDIKISTNLSDNLPMTYLDKDQIQQTLINLALNAIEATDPGGNVKFSTETNPETGMIHIDISDTGCGIPKENLDKIFDPFFTTRETGTGLGLAITHGIIEQHGGTIEVESTPGKGTCFTIMLPVKQGEKHGA